MKVKFIYGVYLGSLQDKTNDPREVVISVKPKLHVPQADKVFTIYGELPEFKGRVLISNPLGDLPNSKLKSAELKELGLHRDWDKSLGLREIQLDIAYDLCYVSYDIIISESNNEPFTYAKSRYLTCSRYTKADRDRSVSLYLTKPKSSDGLEYVNLTVTNYRGVHLRTAIEEGCIHVNHLGKSATYVPSFSYIPYFVESLRRDVGSYESTVGPKLQPKFLGSYDSLLDSIDY